MLVLLVKKIIFPTRFSSFNVEALLPPSRLVLSCRLVSSLVFASLLFSFSFSFSSLPPLRLFQAGHALAHSRACRKTYKNLGFSTRFAGTRCQLGSISLTLSRRYSRPLLLHDFVLTPQPVHLPSHVVHKPLATISSLLFLAYMSLLQKLCVTHALSASTVRCPLAFTPAQLLFLASCSPLTWLLHYFVLTPRLIDTNISSQRACSKSCRAQTPCFHAL